MVSPTLRDVTVRANTFYNINDRGLSPSPQTAWSNILFDANRFFAPPSGSCMVNHSGSFTAVTYSNNQYDSTVEFCLAGAHRTLAQWNTASGETNAQVFAGTLVGPNRTLATYAVSLGYASADEFLTATQTLSRFNWQTSLTANAVNNYIKAGFMLQ